MSAKHTEHRILTHREQVQRGAQALDTATYRDRARLQIAEDTDAEGHTSDKERISNAQLTPNALGTSQTYTTSERGSAYAATSAPASHEDSLLSRDNAAAHYGVRHSGRKHRFAIRRGAIIITAALALVGIGVFAFVHTINERMNAGIGSDLLAVLTGHRGDEPFYMLLLGVDKDSDRAATDGSDYHNFRADTIILARIDARAARITLVSIPRDTQVDMGEYGQQKINAAYSIGGAAYITEIVGRLAGVNIAHYAEVDLDGFSAIVDQIGGIDIELPVSVVDPNYTGLNLAEGPHHLDGHTALMLVRTRHAYDAYGAGDYYRAANQRMVIEAIAHKVLASDPLTLSHTVATLAEYLTCDLDVATIARLASSMRDSDRPVEFMTGQAPTTSKNLDGIWYEVLDTVAWQNMMLRVDAGETPYAEQNDDPTLGMVGVAVTDDSAGNMVEFDYSGTVTVLNATNSAGLAGEAAAALNSQNFEATAANASTQQDASSIVYNGDDARAKAYAVAEVLGLDAIPLPNDGALPTDANVIVVLGTSSL